MIEMTEDLLRRLIAGDQDAQEEARKLLPEVENLFGRWATHPKYGRVLCSSDKVGRDGRMSVYFRDAQCAYGSNLKWVPLESLTFDPVELATEQDFDNAPEGTVVVNKTRYPREKHNGRWVGGYDRSSRIGMETTGPWQVVRWGQGERV